MKNFLEYTVYYGDTDAYGVVWHGAYLRWMEQGRVEICREMGLDLTTLKEEGILIPVTNANLRYKASAKLDDRIVLETYISKLTPLTITFTHIIKNKETDKPYVIGEIEVVAVNGEGRIYRRLPDILKNACEKAMKE